MPIDCETHDLAVLEAARLQRRVAELEEALAEAIDEWASSLNMSPNIRSRKRLDRVRELIGQ
jgi:uncharacterized protein (UPF0212 family)